MNFDPLWGQSGQSIQQFWQEQWSRSLQSLQQIGSAAPVGLSGWAGAPNPWAGVMDALQSAMPQMQGAAGQPVQFDADRLKALQEEYVRSVQSLADQQAIQGLLAKDKRFAAPEWGQNPVAAATAANYLLSSRMLTGLAEAV